MPRPPRTRRRRLVPAVPSAVALALSAALLVGCEADRSLAVVLVADRDRGQWSSVDLPALEERVAQRCDGCEVRIESADGDVDRQADQLDAALEEGADVVALDPVSATAAEGLVDRAGEVPVVAWRTVVPGADLYVGSDPARVAALLAAEVGRRVGPAPRPGQGGGQAASRRVLAIGPPGGLVDAVAGRLPDGIDLEQVGVGSGVRQTLAGTDLAPYDAVLVPNDELAAEAARALGGGDSPALVAPGGGLDAARRIVAGRQAATVHEPAERMAGQVADAVVAVLVGDGLPAGPDEVAGVPGWAPRPRVATVETLTGVMVRDGAIGIDELCAGDTRRRCEALGLM